nr:GNAT family N-acetyltransferase [Niveibacterium umoris]
MPAVCALLAEAVRWLDASGRPMWRMDEVGAAQVLPWVKRGSVHLVCLAGEPVATYRLQPEDEVFWPDPADADALFLHRIAIARAHAGKGILAAIVAQAKREARAARRGWLRLDCASDRTGLRRAYEREGFLLRDERVCGAWHVARYESAV